MNPRNVLLVSPDVKRALQQFISSQTKKSERSKLFEAGKSRLLLPSTWDKYQTLCTLRPLWVIIVTCRHFTSKGEKAQRV